MHKKVFFLIILFHILLWLALKPVWPFSDDYCYAHNAFQFNSSDFALSGNVFQNRLGVYLPVSMFFKLFGISTYTISLWPLLASILTLTVIYIFVSKIADSKTALLSSFLISINILQVLYSTALFPDIFIELYAIACVLLLYYGREIKQKSKILPFLFVLSAFLGLFTKETILLIIPFFIFIAIYDSYKKRCFSFWKWTIIFSILFSILFFTFYYVATGDAFFRLKNILAINHDQLYDASMKEYISTHYYDNILKWLNSELGIIFILLFALSTLLTIKKYDLTNFKIFISVFSFSLLLLFIALFYSDKYGVLFMMDRVWMLCIPPLCILTAYFMANMHHHFCVVLVILFIILTIYNFNAFEFKRGLLFSVFLVITLLTYYLSRRNSKWSNLLLLPFAILAINFVWGNSNYRVGSLQSSNLIKNELESLNLSDKKIILTNSDFVENHIIYNGFKEYSNLTFFPFSKYDSLNTFSPLYVIVNTEEANVPEFILKKSNKWKKEYESGKLLIYKK